MTDKDIKDYCKNCKVEPPAMKFKCPECEHNPDNENNFAKDINVPHKGQIIIDGVDVRKCEYLKESFTGLICADCNKSNDCSKSPNCYFKQLSHKTQECEELKEENNKLIKFNEAVKDIFAPSECDLDDEEMLYMFRELERWNYDAFKYWEKLNDILHGDYRYYGIDPEYIVTLVEELRLRFAHKLRECRRYRKALEEIEEYVKKYECDNCDDFVFGCGDCGTPRDILNIINKVKEKE